jgi:hypothetical protein
VNLNGVMIQNQVIKPDKLTEFTGTVKTQAAENLRVMAPKRYCHYIQTYLKQHISSSFTVYGGNNFLNSPCSDFPGF